MKATSQTAPLVLFLVSACSSQPPPPTSTSRDSAGVTIVENAAPQWGEGVGWRLGARLLQIGALEGEPEYQLYRASSAVRFADGTIVLGNAGTSEIRFFNPRGEFLHSSGGAGEGPGELSQYFRMLRVGGDTLLTWDFRQHRLSVFSPGGDFVRSMLVGQGAATTSAVEGAFHDGSFVVGPQGMFGPSMEEGYARGEKVLTYMSAEGDSVGTLGEFRDSEWFIRIQSNGGSTMVGAWSLALGKRTSVVFWGDLMFVGTGDDYSIQVVRSSGEVVRIIRRQHAPVEVTGAIVSEMIDSELADLERDDRAGQRETLEAMPRPDFLPAYSSLRTDVSGNLWVEEYSVVEPDETTWSVFGPDGVWLGDVSLPSDLAVREIGEDYVLGRVTDDLDVEYIVLYELQKTDVSAR